MRIIGRQRPRQRALGLDVVDQGLRVQQVGVDVVAAGVHRAEGGVAVAPRGQEVVRHHDVGACRIDRRPLAAGALAHLNLAEALALGLAHVQVPAQAGGVRVRAVAARGHAEVVVDRVLQHRHHLRAAQGQFDQHVGEGHDREGVVHGQGAGGQRHAHAAGVLQRQVGAQAGGQEGFGHDLRDVAAARQRVGGLTAGGAGAAVGRLAGHAHQAQGLAGVTDLACLHGLDLIGVVPERGGRIGLRRQHLHGRVGRQLGGDLLLRGGVDRCPGAAGVAALEALADDQRCLAAAAQELAFGVETKLQFADRLAEFPGLADAHRLAVLVDGVGGVGAGAGERGPQAAEVAQQRVRVAADDGVDIGQLRRDRQVGRIAQVAQQHDVVHAARFQLVDAALRRGQFILEHGAGQRARGVHGRRLGGDADDADRHALDVPDGVGLQIVARRARGQRGAGLRRDVRRQHRRPALAGVQVVDEAGQLRVAVVELVVAHGHGVEAHAVHQRGVGFALEQRVVQGAGGGVAGVQLEHVVAPVIGLESLADAGEAAQFDPRRRARHEHLDRGERVQAGVVVVDVGDGQLERRRRRWPHLVCTAAAAGQRGGQQPCAEAGERGRTGGGARGRHGKCVLAEKHAMLVPSRAPQARRAPGCRHAPAAGSAPGAEKLSRKVNHSEA